MTEKNTVAGIGELLWDVFPNHRRFGGAPANFAYHTHQLGANSWPISCIGSDDDGRELRGQMDALKIDSSYVDGESTYPTGTVDVVLVAGKPTYEIHENVAWDHIPSSPELLELAGTLDAVCFGSLSQRAPESRKTIQQFLRSMPDDALKIFDVNLRQQFFSREVIESSLELANVLKLSDEELPVLAEYFELDGSIPNQLRQLCCVFDLQLVAYTRGSEGSLLMGQFTENDFEGFTCDAIDTVGAGDSFTAALCTGLLRKWPLSDVNRFANEVAMFVCTQKGATPTLPKNLINYNRSAMNEEIS